MNSIPVTGLISPVYNTDNYPVIDPLFGIDGLRNVYALSDMYNIPIEKRRGGMLVGVNSTSSNNTTYYTLKPQGGGVTWSVGGNSEWIQLITGLSVSVVPVLNNISNTQVYVPNNYQYLIYGNLTIGSGGTLSNSGSVVIINGTISTVSGGTYSISGGTTTFLNIPTTQKFSASFSAAPNAILTITHSMGTSDIVFTIRDGSNYIYPNIELGLDPNNSIILTTSGTISNGRINIMG